jgi:hypothetical protein
VKSNRTFCLNVSWKPLAEICTHTCMTCTWPSCVLLSLEAARAGKASRCAPRLSHESVYNYILLEQRKKKMGHKGKLRKVLPEENSWAHQSTIQYAVVSLAEPKFEIWAITTSYSLFRLQQKACHSKRATKLSRQFSTGSSIIGQLQRNKTISLFLSISLSLFLLLRHRGGHMSKLHIFF